MAYSKYGENHAKTAMELGLVQRNSGYYFLTALGEAYNDLSEENNLSGELCSEIDLLKKY